MAKKKVEPAKTVFESKTFWGVAIMLGATLLGAEIDEVTQQAIVKDLATIAGAALAIYGRLKAVKRVSGI